MPDSRRLPVSHDDKDDAALRLRQIDALLDEGLECYFAARYEDAIHLWTRVLFLDRSHARARAYIDRARTALAELQRRSDELLQASRDLLEQGETDAARRLLTEAVAASGDDLQASAIQARLERLERARPRNIEPGSLAPASEPAKGWSWSPRRARLIGAGVAVAVLIGAVALVLEAQNPLAPWETAIVPAPVQTLPVMTSSEVALVRAQSAMARGRLPEALRELDRVGPETPDAPAANQLRIEIQQLLMASVRGSSATSTTEPIRR